MTKPHTRPQDGLHVAIIMDGNGRWAQRRRLPRIAGHRRGAKAVRRTVEAAPELGISTLTLYAFSSDNWSRPPAEVQALMGLFETHLANEKDQLVENGVRLNIIGRRDRLSERLRRAIATTEAATGGGKTLHLRIAVDYSARDAIVAAARLAKEQHVDADSFSRLLNRVIHSDPVSPDVDLLIRTSGEQRLSDFLLWECAYAELLFTEGFWPDFGREDLCTAIETFHQRDRRFGTVRPSEPVRMTASG